MSEYAPQDKCVDDGCYGVPGEAGSVSPLGVEGQRGQCAGGPVGLQGAPGVPGRRGTDCPGPGPCGPVPATSGYLQVMGHRHLGNQDVGAGLSFADRYQRIESDPAWGLFMEVKPFTRWLRCPSCGEDWPMWYAIENRESFKPELHVDGIWILCPCCKERTLCERIDREVENAYARPYRFVRADVIELRDRVNESTRYLWHIPSELCYDLAHCKMAAAVMPWEIVQCVASGRRDFLFSPGVIIRQQLYKDDPRKWAIKMVNTWKDTWGDPDDPKIQAKIQETAEQLMARAQGPMIVRTTRQVGKSTAMNRAMTLARSATRVYCDNCGRIEESIPKENCKGCGGRAWHFFDDRASSQVEVLPRAAKLRGLPPQPGSADPRFPNENRHGVTPLEALVRYGIARKEFAEYLKPDSPIPLGQEVLRLMAKDPMIGARLTALANMAIDEIMALRGIDNEEHYCTWRLLPDTPQKESLVEGDLHVKLIDLAHGRLNPTEAGRTLLRAASLLQSGDGIVQRQMAKLQLITGGQVSRTGGLKSIGLDFRRLVQREMEDQQFQAKAQAEQQEQMAQQAQLATEMERL